MSRDQTVHVRDEDAFDIDAVASWLRSHADAAVVGREELGAVPTVRQFPGGASNLTYLLQYPTRDLILRRPPVGAKAKSAHDMNREFTIQSRLRPVFDYVPRMVAFCDDQEVLGSDFYVMERLEGTILRRDLTRYHVIVDGEELAHELEVPRRPGGRVGVGMGPARNVIHGSQDTG